MIIEYLNLLKKTTLILGRENEGVSLKKIEEYEQATNILFPKAYKEFLSLSGFSTGVLGFQNNGGFPEYSHKQQKYTKETLKRYGVRTYKFC